MTLYSNPDAILKREFLFARAPFAACHAATIEESKFGLVTAWFGGKHEGSPDVGIWLARLNGTKWTSPIKVATGTDPSGKREPCWNPVLFQPRTGPLMLFYKVGPSPMTWWGMLKTSNDGGLHWSASRRLPDGILGPIKNRPLQLPNGDILAGSSTEGKAWQVHFEKTTDLGMTWTKTAPVNGGVAIPAIQPSLVPMPDGRIVAIGRTKESYLFEITTLDEGKNWGPMSLMSLPNPNSGADATMLKDGRVLVVYNHLPGAPGAWGQNRWRLNVAISKDLINWEAVAVIENHAKGEYSYPSVIQTGDGLIHIVYTSNRKRIRHVVLDPKRIVGKPIEGEFWPSK
jgi:predicted neuraminidase